MFRVNEKETRAMSMTTYLPTYLPTYLRFGVFIATLNIFHTFFVVLTVGFEQLFAG